MLAVFAIASMGVFAFIGGTDDSDAGYVISSDTDFVQTGKTIVIKVENPTSDKVFCKWDLNDSSGKSQKSGSFDVDVNNYYEVEVTAPSTAGDHKFVVKFYSNEDKADENLICERAMDVKVVEPVTIKVTFENTSTNEVTFMVYLMVKHGDNWEKVADSEKSVTVSAYNPETKKNGTGTYTHDYVARDLDRTTVYKLGSDEKIAEGIEGLNKEMSFYTVQNDYTFITWFLIIVLIILIVIMIWIYRKPVKNFGKPKGRK